MAVTYTRDQRAFAKEHGLALATIAVGGLEYQAPIPKELVQEVLKFFEEFHAKRSEWFKKSFPKKEPSDGVSGT